MTIRKFLARLKRRLLKKPYIKDKRYPAYWFEKVLGGKNAFLLQIGSNDGKTGDPLYPLLHKNPLWKALFVEPVPYLFERLKNNYPDTSRFSFENAAIGEGQQLNFYWVDPVAKEFLPGLPYWYDQLGSFDKQHIANELQGILIPYIRSLSIETLTLNALFDRHRIEKIDLLHIDTEGHDWKILSQLDQVKWSPTFILFEHNHLPEEEIKASKVALKERYNLFDVGIDILAVNKNLPAQITLYMNKFMKKLESS